MAGVYEVQLSSYAPVGADWQGPLYCQLRPYNGRSEVW